MTKADFIVRTQKIDNHALGMLKVFFLLFEPAVAWDKIAQAKRGFVYILATYLLPLVLLATALEGWGLKEWGKWQPHEFHRYLDIVIAAFGTDRVMIGSDWPVCTLSGDYRSVLNIVIEYIRQFPTETRAAILGGNCSRFYGI